MQSVYFKGCLFQKMVSWMLSRQPGVTQQSFHACGGVCTTVCDAGSRQMLGRQALIFCQHFYLACWLLQKVAEKILNLASFSMLNAFNSVLQGTVFWEGHKTIFGTYSMATEFCLQTFFSSFHNKAYCKFSNENENI